MRGLLLALAGHDRHTDALSWAIPINTTFPSPPSAAAASINGRASASLLSPFLKCTTRMLFASAKRWTSLT
jgi:hypothetical protein